MRRGNPRQCANPLSGFDAIEAGHLPIDKDDVVGLVALNGLLDHLDTFLARRRFIHLEGHAGQHARLDFTGLRVVVDDQDASTAKVGRGDTLGLGLALAKIGREPEGAALS